jgi:hypothetical protein
LVGNRFDLRVEAIVAEGLILAEGQLQIGERRILDRGAKERTIGFLALAGVGRKG